jgi:antitoxin component of RelBE/YafQ-DinJ toxin-antitoxin module
MKSVINIKTNKEVKKNAQKIAKDIGISLSDVVNASLRNFIRTREVYFSAIPRMTPEFERLVGRINKDIKEKKNLSPSLSSSEKINDYLDNL